MFNSFYQPYFANIRTSIDILIPPQPIKCMGNGDIERTILKVLERSSQPVSKRELSLKTGRAWHSVNTRCLKLQLAGKVNGFRISNINVWQLNRSLPRKPSGFFT